MKAELRFLIILLCIGLFVGFGTSRTAAGSDLVTSLRGRKAQVRAIQLQLISENLNQYKDWVEDTYRRAYNDLGEEIARKIANTVGGSFTAANSIKDLTEAAIEWQGSVVEAYKNNQAKRTIQEDLDLGTSDDIMQKIISIIDDEIHAARYGSLEEVKEKNWREFELIEYVNGYIQAGPTGRLTERVDFLRQLQSKWITIEQWCHETFQDIHGHQVNHEEHDELHDWFVRGARKAG